MCDFSLHSVRSRSAKVGDRLVTHDFGTGTRGFADVDERGVAVCVMPGTELAFDRDVMCPAIGPLHWKTRTQLCEKQLATVLQLPAQPKTETEARDQERVACTG